MSNAERIPWASRWAMVQERLRAENRAMTDEQKLTQLASLMASVDDFEWRASLGEDDDRVRALWTRLRASASHGP